jgi:hypothetical protein
MVVNFDHRSPRSRGVKSFGEFAAAASGAVAIPSLPVEYGIRCIAALGLSVAGTSFTQAISITGDPIATIAEDRS